MLGQRPHKASDLEMKKFHTDEYIDFLLNISPDNMDVMHEVRSCLRASLSASSDTIMFHRGVHLWLISLGCVPRSSSILLSSLPP